MIRLWYCRECEMAGIERYYTTRKELFEKHPVLKNARFLITYKEVEK